METGKEKLKALLTLLVPQIIDEITSGEGVSETEALEQFYRSRLYSDIALRLIKPQRA